MLQCISTEQLARENMNIIKELHDLKESLNDSNIITKAALNLRAQIQNNNDVE